MSRHHEKAIARAQEVVASVGQPTGDPEPMTRAQIESFVKGFGLSAKATQRIVDRWVADSAAAQSAGWESHAEATYYDQW